MQTVRYVYWQDEGGWLGYLEEYPDYWTQGDSLDELGEQLKDLYSDLTSGQIPGVRTGRGADHFMKRVGLIKMTSSPCQLGPTHPSSAMVTLRAASRLVRPWRTLSSALS